MDCKIIHPTDTEFNVSHVSKDVILHPSPVSLRTFSNLIDGVEVIKQFSKKKTDQNGLQIQSKLEAKLSPDFGTSSVSLSKR